MTTNDFEKNTSHTLESLLSGCSKETLIQLLLRQAERDASFEKLLRLRFSEPSGAQALLKSFSSAIHEMDYDDSLMEIAEEILVQAEQLDLPEQARVYTEMIQEINDAWNDDAFYELYYEIEDDPFDVMYECAKSMEQLARQAVDSGNRAVMDAVWEQFCTSDGDMEMIYEDDYWYIAMLEFCKLPEYREKMYQHLDMQIGWEDRHQAQYQRRKLFVMEQYGTEEEKRSYLLAHVEIDDFRHKAISMLLAEKNYAQAEQLALEGAERSDSVYDKAGWFQHLEEIYACTGDSEAYGLVCRQLVVYGKTKYYMKWKQSLPEEDRAEAVEKLLNAVEENAYVYIIRVEHMANRIYAYCQIYPPKIVELQPELKGSQWEEPGRQIYENLILKMAGNASGRKEYANVCRVLKQYEETCGKEYAEDLAMEIRQGHPRQPAFLDELQKIGM